MHILVTTLHSAVLAASSSSKPSTSAGSTYGSLIFILLLGVLAYFFFLRPRSQQARRQRDTLQQVTTGDEILTGAGIFGTVLDVEPDRVTIETAPGTRITVLRSTIARIFTEHEEQDGGWSGDHEAIGPGGDEHDEHDYDEHDYDEHDYDEHDEHEGHADADDDDAEPEDEAAAGGETGVK